MKASSGPSGRVTDPVLVPWRTSTEKQFSQIVIGEHLL